MDTIRTKMQMSRIINTLLMNWAKKLLHMWQLINGCLQSVGTHMNGTGNGATGMAEAPAWAPAFAPAPGPSAAGSGTNNGSTASIMCQGPCFEEMMLMMTCVNDILVDNIQGYSPGLMQGIEAIFQMFCGAGGGTSNAVVAAGTSAIFPCFSYGL